MIRGVRLRRRVEWGAEESRQEPILRIPCETVIEELAAMVEREKDSGLGDMESHCRVSVPSLLCDFMQSILFSGPCFYLYEMKGLHFLLSKDPPRSYLPAFCYFFLYKRIPALCEGLLI